MLGIERHPRDFGDYSHDSFSPASVGIGVYFRRKKAKRLVMDEGGIIQRLIHFLGSGPASVSAG